MRHSKYIMEISSVIYYACAPKDPLHEYTQMRCMHDFLDLRCLLSLCRGKTLNQLVLFL